MKKNLLLFVVIVLISVNVFAGGKKEEAKGDGAMKVALILPSPRDDGGWSTTAYEGLMDLRKNYGVEVAYTESVSNVDAEEIIRGYAVQGYDWIISHSFTYGDIVKEIAKDFPKIYFTVNSSNIYQAANVSSFNYTPLQMGFLAGAVAGLVTNTNKVAAVGGKEIPPILDALEGFSKGAKYTNPGVEALTLLTGNFDDVAQAKETGLALIDRGVDTLMADSDTASLGVIQAAAERNIYYIGANSDQNPAAPNAVVTSALKQMTVAMDFIYNEIIGGRFEAKHYSLGVREGAVGLAPYHGFENKLSPEVKGKISSLLDDLANGRIDLASLPK